MELITNILGMACMAALIVDLISTIDVNEKLPQKPLKCALCMGFWFSIGFNLFTYGFEGIFYSAMSGVLAELIDRKLNDF